MYDTINVQLLWQKQIWKLVVFLKYCYYLTASTVVFIKYGHPRQVSLNIDQVECTLWFWAKHCWRIAGSVYPDQAVSFIIITFVHELPSTRHAILNHHWFIIEICVESTVFQCWFNLRLYCSNIGGNMYIWCTPIVNVLYDSLPFLS